MNVPMGYNYYIYICFSCVQTRTYMCTCVYMCNMGTLLCIQWWVDVVGLDYRDMGIANSVDNGTGKGCQIQWV